MALWAMPSNRCAQGHRPASICCRPLAGHPLSFLGSPPVRSSKDRHTKPMMKAEASNKCAREVVIGHYGPSAPPWYIRRSRESRQAGPKLPGDPVRAARPWICEGGQGPSWRGVLGAVARHILSVYLARDGRGRTLAHHRG